MSRIRGYTLIELMIVVAVVGILAMIAVPAYRDYVLRGKITEAVSTLSDMRVRLEQYYQDNRKYTGACAAGTLAPIPTGKYFTFACPTLADTAYVVTATGIAAQGMGDFSYQVNQGNQRKTLTLPSGWAGANKDCWVLKKDGSC